MSQTEFLPLLETEPQLHGAAFDRAELRTWLATMWPHVEDDPDVYCWAGEFLEARRAVATS
jgi:hypothetical protein